jgi:hypothetical protein
MDAYDVSVEARVISKYASSLDSSDRHDRGLD